jgi:lipopolysaccharide biosynthesis glycosyltransferase
VEAVHYKQYETLQNMASKPLPAVIHFVSDGKPWVVLAMVRVQAWYCYIIVIVSNGFFYATLPLSGLH